MMFKVRLLDLPGFKSMDQYPFVQLFPDDKPAIELYTDFKARLCKALDDKIFFPVMRMCDGEYIYCTGKRKHFDIKGWRVLKYYAGKLLKRQVTSWGESYTRKQNRDLKKGFPLLLREISRQGIIANHFMYSHTHFCEEYIQPMQKWFDKNGIDFISTNFTAFYFVYVLLNGPDSLEFFKNKSVLILSSFDEIKRNSVETELKRRGAKVVYFEQISKSQSMLDKPELTKYTNQVDLALIAGGIGAANLLMQCKPLNILCIDAGFSLECIADSSRRTERIFCMPDAPF